MDRAERRRRAAIIKRPIRREIQNILKKDSLRPGSCWYRPRYTTHEAVKKLVRAKFVHGQGRPPGWDEWNVDNRMYQKRREHERMDQEYRYFFYKGWYIKQRADEIDEIDEIIDEIEGG